ncbi:PQQ-binding-like beta-propeller repeat protein [Candidatus Latescibacterota bacterium]
MSYSVTFRTFVLIVLFNGMAFSPGIRAAAAPSPNDTIDSEHPGEVATLAFHNVLPGKVDVSSYTLPPLLFEKMLEELMRSGYRFLSTPEYMDYIVNGKPIPARSVYLTFDDGQSSMYEYVFPLLKKYSIHATVFLIASRYDSPHYITTDQIREMQSSGLVDFQSHTYNLHYTIDDKAAILRQQNESDSQHRIRVTKDLLTSRQAIEALTGEPVTALALPFGTGDGAAEEFAREAGFGTVLYCGDDTRQSYGDNPFHLNRIGVYRYNAKVLAKLLVSNHFHLPSITKKPSTSSSPATDPHIRMTGAVNDCIVYSSPAVGPDGTVYVGSWDGNLHAFNPDGSVRWAFAIDAGLSSSPAVGSDGIVYIASYNGRVYAIGENGCLVWQYLARAPVFVSPAIGGDGTVYVATIDRDLLAIGSDGSLKWSYWVGELIFSSPSIGSDGTVYVGAWNNRLYAVNPDGSTQWIFTTGAPVDTSPAVGDDGAVYFGCMDNSVYVVNRDGSPRWTFETGGYVDSSPAIGTDGTVYAGSWDGCLYALRRDGTLLWQFQTGGKIESSPSVGSDGSVYVGSDDGCIYAVNPDGSERWHVATNGGINSSPAITHDGILYVGSMDSYIYGIDTGCGLASGSWPKFRANSRNTSRKGDKNTVSIDNRPPVTYSIFATYPNPFNASVSFRYSIEIMCHVDLAIFDILGRKIASLADENRGPGVHETVWNARDNRGMETGTGMYIYRFDAGNTMKYGKIMQIR